MLNVMALALFATFARPLRTSRPVQVPPGLELEYRDKVRRVDQRLVFGPFVRAEIAFVGSLRERIDPLLYWRIDPKVNEASRGLRVEAAAQWVVKTIQPG